MRVNISLSVELENVPLKVSAMLAENYDKIKEAAQFVAEASNNLIIEDNVRGSLDDINQAQKTIHDVFSSLDDLNHILVGYEKILIDKNYGQETQLSLSLDTDGEENV
tara:strand:- start:179 stop:502 length:324 start_codon:yes stop_codon:yes gene_type:complete